jgi:hypothetical protein
MHAVYEGPELPPLPSATETQREFTAIVRRITQEEPRRRSLGLHAVLAGLAVGTAVVALGLFRLPWTGLTAEAMPPRVAGVLRSDLPQEVPSLEPLAPSSDGSSGSGGIGHPAQSYGRIVAGRAQETRPGPRASLTQTFPVGTSIHVPLDGSLQIALAGRIVANVTAGSDFTWVDATPKQLEVSVERGLVAFRYDRDASDPVLRVRTPNAVVVVVGTVFTVQVDWKSDTVVSVLHGEVEVQDPSTSRAFAEVEAGYRFDVTRSTFSDVGKSEVAAALPLSNGVLEGSHADALADGRIPSHWNVPGLPPDPAHRTLAYVPEAGVPASSVVTRVDPAPRPRLQESDEGENLIEILMRDAEATRRQELQEALETCGELYWSPSTRYRSARCFAQFLQKYDGHPLAIEAHLLLGILRMDYALDYRAAEDEFLDFLSKAPPEHPRAELALYRLWLASTEEGRIGLAIERGRLYLHRYPEGSYVGKILQRFPELKGEL